MQMLDEEMYFQTPALKVAFQQGQLAMLDEIRGLAQNILIQSRLNPFNIKDDYEEGQVSALNSMLEAVIAFEQQLVKPVADESYDA